MKCACRDSIAPTFKTMLLAISPFKEMLIGMLLKDYSGIYNSAYCRV